MNAETLPLVELFGPEEIAGLFQNIYAFLYPAMPIIMISIAISLAGLLISTIRKVFSFDVMAGKEDYGYKEKKENFD